VGAGSSSRLRQKFLFHQNVEDFCGAGLATLLFLLLDWTFPPYTYSMYVCMYVCMYVQLYIYVCMRMYRVMYLGFFLHISIRRKLGLQNFSSVFYIFIDFILSLSSTLPRFYGYRLSIYQSLRSGSGPQHPDQPPLHLDPTFLRPNPVLYVQILSSTYWSDPWRSNTVLDFRICYQTSRFVFWR
jgi:hypothetical protein